MSEPDDAARWRDEAWKLAGVANAACAYGGGISPGDLYRIGILLQDAEPPRARASDKSADALGRAVIEAARAWVAEYVGESRPVHANLTTDLFDAVRAYEAAGRGEHERGENTDAVRQD